MIIYCHVVVVLVWLNTAVVKQYDTILLLISLFPFCLLPLFCLFQQNEAKLFGEKNVDIPLLPASLLGELSKENNTYTLIADNLRPRGCISQESAVVPTDHE
jgi:hypothetical protein